ncbi:hypothetical protein J7M28_11100 [bacterium]|nr:hypothetical protein [bacterium]
MAQSGFLKRLGMVGASDCSASGSGVPLNIHTGKGTRLLGVVCCTATAVFVFYLTYTLMLPIDDLVRFIPDDAFYYVKIAMNVVNGDGFTFDGLGPTSGFQPLFLLLLLPIIGHLKGNPESAVRASILLSGLIWYGCAILAHSLLKRTGGARAAAIAFVSLLVMPSLAIVGFGGLETSLSLLFVLASIITYRSIIRDKKIRGGKWLLFGTLCGLAAIARTDNTLLIAAYIVTFFVLSRRSETRIFRKKSLVLFLLPALAFPVAFFIWSDTVTGLPVQSSGVALSIHSWQLSTPSLCNASDIWGRISETASDFVAKTFGLSGYSACLLPLLLFLLVSAALISDLSHITRFARHTRIMLPLAIQFILLLLFYAGWLGHVQLWYLIPGAALVIIIVSLVCGALCDCLGDAWNDERVSARVTAFLALMIILIGAYRAYGLFERGIYTWQPEMLRAAKYLSGKLPPGSRAGAFNAGILGCFLDSPVVNLDGVVNNRVLRHLKDRTLDQYLADTNVDYLVDYQQSFLLFSRATERSAFAGFERVAEFSGSWRGTNLWVCRRGSEDSLLETTIIKPASGLYSSERWTDGDFDFRWSRGRSSTFSILPSDPNVPLEVLIWAFPFEMCGHSGQSVTVFINGSMLIRKELASGWRLYHLPIPAGLLDPGQNTLAFEFGYTVCPVRDCGSHFRDERELAVAFRPIRCQRK